MKKKLAAALAVAALTGAVGYAADQQSVACHARGQLPDPTCTPGAADPTVTVSDLCPHANTAARRNVPQRVKDNIERRYGYRTFHGEIDHLISLELGGSNDPTNLWPEPGPVPNAKDKIETDLHAWICAAPSAARLAAAQHAISTDWQTAERTVR